MKRKEALTKRISRKLTRQVGTIFNTTNIPIVLIDKLSTKYPINNTMKDFHRQQKKIKLWTTSPKF